MLNNAFISDSNQPSTSGNPQSSNTIFIISDDENEDFRKQSENTIFSSQTKILSENTQRYVHDGNINEKIVTATIRSNIEKEKSSDVSENLLQQERQNNDKVYSGPISTENQQTVEDAEDSGSDILDLDEWLDKSMDKHIGSTNKGESVQLLGVSSNNDHVNVSDIRLLDEDNDLNDEKACNLLGGTDSDSSGSELDIFSDDVNDHDNNDIDIDVDRRHMVKTPTLETPVKPVLRSGVKHQPTPSSVCSDHHLSMSQASLDNYILQSTPTPIKKAKCQLSENSDNITGSKTKGKQKSSSKKKLNAKKSQASGSKKVLPTRKRSSNENKPSASNEKERRKKLKFGEDSFAAKTSEKNPISVADSKSDDNEDNTSPNIETNIDTECNANTSKESKESIEVNVQSEKQNAFTVLMGGKKEEASSQPSGIINKIISGTRNALSVLMARKPPEVKKDNDVTRKVKATEKFKVTDTRASGIDGETSADQITDNTTTSRYNGPRQCPFYKKMPGI